MIVDARGKRCPEPIIDLARALKMNDQERVFTLLSDDPATMSDLSAWSRMTKHQVMRVDENEFLIERNP